MIIPRAGAALLGALLAAAPPAPVPSEAPAAPQARPDSAGEALFRRVDPSVVAIQHERAGGSGFVLTPDGYILTNGHVVMGNDDEDPKAVAKRITVSLHDDRKYAAKVVGHCLDPDVALLKIQPDGPLAPARLGDSDAARPGQRCFAFGMPVGLKRTLTAGILSNVERTDLGTFTIVLQTDAAINPGNSGGPLFDDEGRVLGLNTYAMRGGENLGFTIPISVAACLREHYLKFGRFRRAAIPTLEWRELYDELAAALGVEGGVLVDFVLPGSEAEKAGFATGDVVVAVDGAPVSGRSRAERLRFEWGLVTREVGSKARFKVLRRTGGKTEPLEIEATFREDDPAPATGHQTGEIPQTLYDELGLGVQRVVPRMRILLDLADVPGVLVQTARENTPAEKAGLQEGDMITAVEGEPTPDPDAFRARLFARLAERPKAVRLSYQRGKVAFRTAIAPFYTLAGKRLALLVPGEKGEWADLLRQALLESGAEVAEARLGASPGVADLKAAELDGVLLAGGDGSIGFLSDASTLALIRDAAKGKKALGALGPASLALVTAEPALRGKKMTTAEGLADRAMALKAKYTGKDVESDGKLVTGTGFDKPAVKEFLQAWKTALTAP